MDKKPSITGLEFSKKVAEAFRKGLEAEEPRSIVVVDNDYANLRITPLEVKPEIIVFTSSGKTYNFKNIENLTPTTQGFEFDYTGVATVLEPC